jgi:hypothetical protein
MPGINKKSRAIRLRCGKSFCYYSYNHQPIVLYVLTHGVAQYRVYLSLSRVGKSALREVKKSFVKVVLRRGGWTAGRYSVSHTFLTALTANLY